MIAPTVVTANQRLARSLRQTYAARMRADGKRSWHPPPILPWDAFVQSLWRDAAAARPLFTAAQELSLWESAVGASPESGELLQPQGAAKMAQQAWRLAHQWRLPLESGKHAHLWQVSPETAAFHGWARQVQWRMEWMDRLDSARLGDALQAALRAGQVSSALPAEIELAGFDELTPQQRGVVTALEARGVAVSRRAGPAMKAAVPPRLAAQPDGEAELRAAAAWAAQCRAANPSASVGVVVAGLESVRAHVSRAFTRAVPGEFHISLGPPLSERPGIALALSLLDFCRPQVGWLTMSAVLLSPYIGAAAEERSARARLDVELRNWRAFEIAPRSVARHAACPPGMASMLRVWESIRSGIPEEQSPSQWCATFAKLLEVFGWPASGAGGDLQRGDFEMVAAWRELLSQLASTDVTAESGIGFARASAFLRNLAGEKRFETEGHGEPVQIMGMLEAAGSAFDHLWICGLDEDAWPAGERPNPFLPLSLQRKHGLPHSSAARDLDYARRVTARLLAAAPQVVASYAADGGERERRASPLVADLALLNVDALAGEGGAAYGRATVETEDEAPPPVVAGVGGTSALQLQAKCPFRAFAQLRLGARELEEPELGLDPRERGQFLHAALEALWAVIPNPTPQAIREAVDAAIPAGNVHDEFRRTLLALERERLIGLLTAWFAFERKRTARFTTEAPEQEREVEVGGLRVRIRLDRMDRLVHGGGRRVLIDYKTTAPALGGWDGERPEDPQVPLYAATTEAPLSAVAFAQVKTGEFKFRGYSMDPDALPGAGVRVVTEEELRVRIEEWRRVLARLGADYAAGVAIVDPKRHPETCKHCHLASLCRIEEKILVRLDA